MPTDKIDQFVDLRTATTQNHQTQLQLAEMRSAYSELKSRFAHLKGKFSDLKAESDQQRIESQVYQHGFSCDAYE